MDQIPPPDQEPKRRRDAGIPQVTERDTLVLTWIAEQLCISFDHLQRVLGRYAKATTKTPDQLSLSATRDTITRWLQLGFIEEPRKIITTYPPHIWLSRRGLSQLGLPYAYYKPQVSRITHIYATNAIRLHLESYALQSVWYPERTLIRETTQRPVPDAELRVIGIAHIAINVIETPFKHDITLTETLDTLRALADRYTSLWYFLPSQTALQLHNALTTQDQQIAPRVTFYGLDAQVITIPAHKQKLSRAKKGRVSQT